MSEQNLNLILIISTIISVILNFILIKYVFKLRQENKRWYNKAHNLDAEYDEEIDIKSKIIKELNEKIDFLNQKLLHVKIDISELENERSYLVKQNQDLETKIFNLEEFHNRQQNKMVNKIKANNSKEPNSELNSEKLEDNQLVAQQV